MRFILSTYNLYPLIVDFSALISVLYYKSRKLHEIDNTNTIVYTQKKCHWIECEFKFFLQLMLHLFSVFLMELKTLNQE